MKKRNGFTLVELLTAIAIIVLLVWIFLPSLYNVKQQANSVVCQSNLQNDISFYPIALVIVNPDGISDRPTTSSTLLEWGLLPENPDLNNNYVLNLWICDKRCATDLCRHCRIPHTCTNQSEYNAKGIFSGSLVNKIEQKQSAQ